MLLDSVVSQVDHAVRQVLKSELSATGPQVPVSIEVALHVAIDRGHEGIEPDIKLPLVDQQRVMNVLLNNTSPLLVGS